MTHLLVDESKVVCSHSPGRMKSFFSRNSLQNDRQDNCLLVISKTIDLAEARW